MKELKKFNVLSVGKVFGVFGLAISILQMVTLKLISTNPTIALQYGVGASQFTFKFMSFTVITAAAVYFISGLLVALIYNLVAKHIGGIKFDFDEGKVAAKKVVKKVAKK